MLISEMTELDKIERLKILNLLKQFFSVEPMHKGGILKFKDTNDDTTIYGQSLTHKNYVMIKKWLKND